MLVCIVMLGKEAKHFYHLIKEAETVTDAIIVKINIRDIYKTLKVILSGSTNRNFEHLRGTNIHLELNFCKPFFWIICLLHKME